MRYKVTIKKEDTDMEKSKKSELLLKDLLGILPTLRKHSLDGDVSKKVKTLRNGRRQKNYTLEVTRKFPCFDEETNKPIVKLLKVSAPITKRTPKMEVLRGLKADIINQIKELRQKQQTPIEEYTFPEGVQCRKLAEVYLDEGVFFKVYDKKIFHGITKKAKVPQTYDRYVGVEIELACKESREEMAKLIHEEKLGKHIHLKGDGSIGSGTKLLDTYKNAIEIAVLAKESEIVSVIQKLCIILNEKLHCKVDKTCGLHVHLDMRTRKVGDCFNNLFMMQHFLYGMVPANRKTSTYAKPVSNKEWAPNNDHYEGISKSSFSKHKTIEIRMHCGTTIDKKINGWIQMLLKIIDAPKISESPKNIRSIGPQIGMSEELMLYIESRLAKFAKQHKDIKNETEHLSFLAALDEVASSQAALEVEASELAS